MKKVVAPYKKSNKKVETTPSNWPDQRPQHSLELASFAEIYREDEKTSDGADWKKVAWDFCKQMASNFHR